MRLILAAAALAVIAAFGWHLWLWGEAVERAERVPALRAVDRIVPVQVRLNPVTNHATIRLDVKWSSRPDDLLEDIGVAVAGEIATDVWPPAVEEELAAFARERSDVYAILVPYRVSLGEPLRRDRAE